MDEERTAEMWRFTYFNGHLFYWGDDGLWASAPDGWELVVSPLPEPPHEV